jgi:hypothetical protein
VLARVAALEHGVALGLLVRDLVDVARREGGDHAQDEHEQQRRDREADHDRGQRHPLAERVAHVASADGVDRGGAARQPRRDQRQDGGLGDQHHAEHDADQVAVEQQVRARAEQRRGGQGERELHASPASTSRAR